jgi:hypothetical protein
MFGALFSTAKSYEEFLGADCILERAADWRAGELLVMNGSHHKIASGTHPTILHSSPFATMPIQSPHTPCVTKPLKSAVEVSLDVKDLVDALPPLMNTPATAQSGCSTGSPWSSCSENGDDDNEDVDYDFDSSTANAVRRIVKTDHKLAEESGSLAPEPLLTENPRRFVLFPIQDSEVRS